MGVGSYSTFCYHRAKESGGIKSLLSLPPCGLLAVGDSMLTSRLMLVYFSCLYEQTSKFFGMSYIDLYLQTLLSHE
jgi:hypothetical protein